MSKSLKSKNNSIARRFFQHKGIIEEGVEMYPCSNCIRRDTRCLAHRSSSKFAACVHSTKSCDLIVLSEDWRKLDAERERLRNEIAKRRRLISEAFFELSKLEEEQENLRQNASAMLAREHQNLKEVEEDASR